MNAIYPHLECAVGDVAYEEALLRLLALVPAPCAPLAIATAGCSGHVLAKAVFARHDLPGFDQSAMDGYAVSAADAAETRSLALVGRSAAGDTSGCLVRHGAYRILTGAPMPSGADSVVMQENARVVGGRLILDAVPRRGANVRRQGEDVCKGNMLIPAGTVLDWRHQTMLAAQGIRTVTIRRAVRVAVLSSGNELCAAPDLPVGRIHDSNLPMLAGLLAAWGADVRATICARDDPAAICAALQRIRADVDLVVSTGGISAGEEDHVRTAFHEAGGHLVFLNVAMKPGKPLAFGRLHETICLCLPGNPQAALAGAIGFLGPLLARMTGATAAAPCFARSRSEIRHKLGRSEFVPVRLGAPDGGLWAEVLRPPGSGRLRPVLEADGLAFLRADQGNIAPGDVLPVKAFPHRSCTYAAAA